MSSIWSHLSTTRRSMVAMGLLGLALMQINQPYPQVAWLHHSPTLLFLLSIPFLSRRIEISDRALFCIFAFFALHTVAARYTYSATPYDAWFEAMFGVELNTLMGWERNNFDRLVHFSFGALFALPAFELAQRYAGVGRKFALYIALEFVLGVSAFYEIFEWWLSIVMDPNNAEAYNGQQGDFWDAQKDMALAFLGALISTAIIGLGPRRRPRV